MALNPQFIPDMLLQEGIIDKDTGFPLAAGVITFYSDINRTTLKSAYQITGTPPNYTYAELPNPLTLSSVGTVQDGSGNDVIPYYKAYDANGNVDLYYITVVSAGGTPQFTREGWPNVIATGGTNFNDSLNYVPNGQFYTHSNIVNTVTPNKISQDITVLAPGGWTYERSAGSTASDLITFVRFNSYTSNPKGDPRYAIRVQCTSPGVADAFKDLRIKFTNVNKFASNTQNYRVFFTAINNGSGSLPVQFNIVKNFGTGGTPSTPTTTDITAFNVTNTAYVIYQIAFSFGDNSGKTLGTNNDDFVDLAFSFPTNNLFDVSLTDFGLMMDSGAIAGFPETPDSAFLYRSIAGFMPNPAYDGSDWYLPVQVTPTGMQFDHSVIGDVISESGTNTYVSSLSTTTNRILANGTQLKTTDYSPLGIPYSRLQAKYFNNTLNLPIYGTGAAFLTTYIGTVTTNMRITTNQVGSTTAAADGTAATGFTFNTISTGTTFGGNGFNAFHSAGAQIYIINVAAGNVTSIAAATSTFTVSEIRNGGASIKAIAGVVAQAAAGLAGLYFTLSTTTTNYYVWFKVNGAGADPVPGGTGIEIDLLSTQNATEVAAIVAETLNGYQVSNVIVTGVPAASTFFNIYTTTNRYYVWYTNNGVGTDPAPVGGVLGIKVAVLSTDTAAQVATKTQIVMNSVYFAVPDYRGIFLRGFNNSASVDPQAALRFSKIATVFGDQLGTREYSDIWQLLLTVTDPGHFHTTTVDGQVDTRPGGGGGTAGAGPIAPINWPNTNSATTGITVAQTYNGVSESRPANANVNYAILY